MADPVQKSNPLREKSYAFSVRIIRFCRLMQGQKEYVLSKQLLKSGTSIGANVEEAIHGQSLNDFISKLSIALKEARESLYWLKLIRETQLVEQPDTDRLCRGANELVSMLVAIIKTSKLKKNS